MPRPTAMERAALLAARKPLTGKRLDLLNVLLEGKGIKQAAQEVGITAHDAIHWTQEVGFRSLMLTRLRANLDVYVVRAMLVAPDALATLVSLMKAPPPRGAGPAELIMHAETQRRASQVILEAFMGVVAMTPEFHPRPAQQQPRPMFQLPAGARVAVLVDGRDVLEEPRNGDGPAVSWVEQGAPPIAASGGGPAPGQAVTAVDGAKPAITARPAEVALPVAPMTAPQLVEPVVSARAALPVKPEEQARALPQVEPAVDVRAVHDAKSENEVRAVADAEPEPKALSLWELASPDVEVPGLSHGGTVE